MRYAVIRDFGKRNICQLAAIALLSMSFALPAAAAVPGRKKATAPPVRVACVGNSITYGTGIQDRARDSYPPPSCSACSVLAMSVGAYILMYRAWATRSSCVLTMPTDSPRPTARPRRHLR